MTSFERYVALAATLPGPSWEPTSASCPIRNRRNWCRILASSGATGRPCARRTRLPKTLRTTRTDRLRCCRLLLRYAAAAAACAGDGDGGGGDSRAGGVVAARSNRRLDTVANQKHTNDGCSIFLFFDTDVISRPQ